MSEIFTVLLLDAGYIDDTGLEIRGARIDRRRDFAWVGFIDLTPKLLVQLVESAVLFPPNSVSRLAIATSVLTGQQNAVGKLVWGGHGNFWQRGLRLSSNNKGGHKKDARRESEQGNTKHLFPLSGHLENQGLGTVTTLTRKTI